MTTVRSLIEDFTSRLTAALEDQAMEHARHAVESAFGVRTSGRSPQASALAINKKPPKTSRKKAPLQLCPVPGCKNPAAPIFGMVCAKHKHLSKAKIKKFREARKAKKLGIKVAKAPKLRTKKMAAPKRRPKKIRDPKRRPPKVPAPKRRTEKAAQPNTVAAAQTAPPTAV
jgi:hypothetical protein